MAPEKSDTRGRPAAGTTWWCALTAGAPDGSPLPVAVPIAERLMSECWPSLERTTRAEDAQVLLRAASVGPAAGEQRRLAAVIQAQVRRSTGLVPWIGMATGSNGAKAVLADSRQAIRTARQVWSDPRVVLAEDLLAIIAIGSDRTAAARLAALLSPLLEADQVADGPLVTAVATYIECGLSTTAAAVRVGVHRHTLDQRLRVAETLLGRSIRRYPDRLLIESALVAHRLLSGTGAS